MAAVDLVHTEQTLPVDANGQLRGDSVADQFHLVLSRLDAAGRHVGGSLDQCVKLNVYLERTEDTDAVRTILAERFQGAHKPAVCYVTTKLSLPDALVAADAVMASKRRSTGPVERFAADAAHPACAVLSAGGRIYISGQAESGDLHTATRKTLESLRQSLKFVNVDLSHVVQIKSFLTPVSDVAVVEREIRDFFGEQTPPPLVFVEWISGATTPIEIELIAAAPRDTVPDNAPPVEYLTPPGMTSPPIYSRITRVSAAETIYISGLYGSDNNPEKQVREVFEQLTELLQPAGSDLRHLVKATYYVSDESVSAQLNAQRPNYYDPQRPPAASKAMVSGVGRHDRTLTMDMIAVPH
ncbi:MAG: RidA family protein [Planctomycetaceae bacterium]|nr:RidA family protein [Planctomycetaceae bacterium]